MSSSSRQDRARPLPAVAWVVSAVTFAFVIGFARPDDAPYALPILAFASLAASLTMLLAWRAACELSSGALTLLESTSSRDHRHVTLQTADEDPELVDALAWEKARAICSIREIEIDRAMGKINESDYLELRSRYEGLAMSIIAAIDEEREEYLARAEETFEHYMRSRASEPKPARGEHATAGKLTKETQRTGEES